MRIISKETVHVSKENAAYAVASGALIGAGVFFPPLLGFGIAAGAVGFIRERGRINDIKRENFLNKLKDPVEGRDLRESLGLKE